MDAEEIKEVATWVIEDITDLDVYVLDGIGVSGRLVMLADNYARLLDAPVPPRADPAEYFARLSTLEDFAMQAADEFTYDPIAGLARYEVIRKETKPLLRMINEGLGTNLRLPAR